MPRNLNMRWDYTKLARKHDFRNGTELKPTKKTRPKPKLSFTNSSRNLILHEKHYSHLQKLKAVQKI